MRYPAMSCWLLQGPALRLAVSWYALLGPPVNAAGAGVGLAWRGPRGPRAPWCVVQRTNRRCAAGFIRSAPLRRPAPRTIHGLGTLGASRVPPRRHRSFRATPAWGQLPMREVGPCMLVLRASGCARAGARDGLAQARQGALVSIARWARARCHSGAFIRHRQGRNELV